MPEINDYPININLPTGTLVRDARSNVEQTARPLVQGDYVRLLVRALKPHPTAGSVLTKLWTDVELPSQIYVGIGNPAATPTGGTFKLTFGADTTAALAYDASAAAVQTALNALASVTAAGGVTVSGAAGGPYQVSFVSAGDRALISGNADAIYPLSQFNIYPARQGTVDVTEIQIIALEVQSAALASTFTDFPAAFVAIEELQAGATNVPSVQRVSVNEDAYDGTFTLSFDGASTSGIPFDVSAADLSVYLAALSTIGTGNVSVTGAFPAWTVSLEGALVGAQPAIVGDASGLVVPVGKIGYLDLRTAGVEQLVAGQSEVTTTLEVQAMYGGDKPVTILQTPVVVKNDQIPSAPGLPPDLPSYLTTAAGDGRYPRYDVAVSYTAPQKAQFAANLGLGPLATKTSAATADIDDAAITSAKLAASAVTAAKLASDAVETAKIKDANVTAAKLASDAVETAKIKDANVTAAKLADEAVETAKVKNAAITGAKIADATIGAAKLASVITAGSAEIERLTFDASGLVTGYVPRLRAVLLSPITTTATTSDNDGLSLPVPANRLAVGDVIRFEMLGETTNSTTASNVNFYVKINGSKSTLATFAMGTTALTSGFIVRGTVTLVSSTTLRVSFAVNWRTSQAIVSGGVSFTVSLASINTVAVGCNCSVATGTSITNRDGYIQLN